MESERIFRQLVTYKRTVSHTERVVEMCKYFADRMNLSARDRNLLLDSAYLHDIAKSGFGEAHNLPENVDEVLGNKELPNDIYEVILNHKDNFSPKSELAMVCSILRICDKLDKFNKKAADAEFKCNSAMALIQEHLTPDEFKQFKAIYDEIYFTKIE